MKKLTPSKNIEENLQFNRRALDLLKREKYIPDVDRDLSSDSYQVDQSNDYLDEDQQTFWK